MRLIEVKNAFKTNPSEKEEEEIRKAFKSVVLQMRNEAVKNCPVDSGTLKGSVASHPIEVNENTFQIGSEKDYAIYVHDGTSKMAARPFIEHAIDQLEDQFEVVIDRVLGGN